MNLRSLSRSTLNTRQFIRNYAVRSEHNSPFDYLPKRGKKSYINWKTTGVFVALGAYLSYNEVLLDRYAEFTETNENNELLPVQLEYKLSQLPIYQNLNHPKKEKWTKLETWEDLDHNILDKQQFTRHKKRDERSMVSQTLAKPGGFLIKPVIFHNQDTNEGVTIVHAGYKLCGYPFIVHGGILATILNETFKRNAALSKDTTSSYKGDFKVENLSISYKFPSFANQFLIIKTRKVPIDGENDKLIKLESIIESEGGKILVKSEALLHDTGFVSNRSKLKHLKHYIGI